MLYPFVNTIIRQRDARLPINKLKALVEGGSKTEILEILNEFDIENTNLSLLEANIKINNAFRREAQGLSNLLKGSEFLHLFTRRFEIFGIIEFITNFNEFKISSKVINNIEPFGLEPNLDLKTFVNKLNTRFGFNLNQSSRVGELRDQILRQYLIKLSSIGSGEAKLLVIREHKLVETLHREDFIHFLSENRTSWFYNVLKGDRNLLDLKYIFYLYGQAQKLAIKNPLGEMVTMYYIYKMDLSYKLIKALYLSIKKGIKLDFEQVWET
jgi:hypothetical protein